ncbi:hypothetical protein KCTC32420_00011 [Aequorivita nionensis]
MYKQWLVLAYLENPADFQMASICLQLSVSNHAIAHTLNVNEKQNRICKKNPAIFIAGFYIYTYLLLLIISKPSNLCNIFRQANNLVAIAVFIVIPNIKHYIFTIFGNNGCVAVINCWSRRTNNIA